MTESSDHGSESLYTQTPSPLNDNLFPSRGAGHSVQDSLQKDSSRYEFVPGKSDCQS